MYGAGLRRSGGKSIHRVSSPDFCLGHELQHAAVEEGVRQQRRKNFFLCKVGGLNRSVFMAHNRYFVMVESMSKWEEMVL